MACDAATLIDQGKCLAQGLSTHQLYAAWAYLLCSSVVPPPPGGTGITTDPDGLTITDENGNIITLD